VPHDPPHESSPHAYPAHCGVQQAPEKQTWPPVPQDVPLATLLQVDVLVAGVHAWHAFPGFGMPAA
jgi:hypothetical protein